MTVLDLKTDSEAALQAQFPERDAVIKAIKHQGEFDVVVVGGGVHGACFARLAAFNGLKTLLLEKSDYASATSSRSSKMAHGGLRYLELLDFKQVREGIRAREELFTVAKHLVRPYPFLVPVNRGDAWFRLKLGLGLWFYDSLVREKSRRYKWINSAQLKSNSIPWQSEKFSGAFQYCDGLMDDTRLVIENIVAARQEGALCLNYASLVSFSQRRDGKVEVGWKNENSGEIESVGAGVVVNCAGPWVPTAGRLSPGPLAQNVAYSQGTHLVFDVPWEKPALFLPLSGRGRYYFVWPYKDGTMVGTTEREITTLSADPMPTPDEVNEILARIERDLPDSGLSRDKLYYCFAGVRTLPLRRRGGNITELSRRHIWHYANGMLSLLGGKFTTAALTVEEGLQQVFKLAGIEKKITSLFGRDLPGAAFFDTVSTNFRQAIKARHIPAWLGEAALSRLGARVRYFESEQSFEVIGGYILRGEVDQAFDVEQAENIEDLLRRRLMQEISPHHGLRLLDALRDICQTKRPKMKFEAEALHYRERLNTIQSLCRGSQSFGQTG